MTVRTDQNPVSLNIVHRLLVIDCADERVDPFQKRPTKTPFRFRLTCLPRVTRSTSRDFPCPEPAARVLPEISSSSEGAAATDIFFDKRVLAEEEQTVAKCSSQEPLTAAFLSVAAAPSGEEEISGRTRAAGSGHGKSREVERVTRGRQVTQKWKCVLVGHF